MDKQLGISFQAPLAAHQRAMDRLLRAEAEELQRLAEAEGVLGDGLSQDLCSIWAHQRKYFLSHWSWCHFEFQLFFPCFSQVGTKVAGAAS